MTHTYAPEANMNPVRLEDNHNGKFTAWIFSSSFTGSYEECQSWLRGHGEHITWSVSPAQGMGPTYHHLIGLSRPMLLNCTSEEAHKIAAAEEMYKALKALQDVGMLEDDSRGMHGGKQEAKANARAILAKLASSF